VVCGNIAALGGMIGGNGGDFEDILLKELDSYELLLKAIRNPTLPAACRGSTHPPLTVRLGGCAVAENVGRRGLVVRKSPRGAMCRIVPSKRRPRLLPTMARSAPSVQQLQRHPALL
jgi:hypothetical protein